MQITANWIWSDDSPADGYNLCSVFRREFRLEELPETAVLAVSADSFYRLRVNGQWLCDGPARGYAEHTFYDTLDLNGILRNGRNIMEITVRSWGTGCFRGTPKRGGLLCQLDMKFSDGRLESIKSDENFLSAVQNQLVQYTPRSSCQTSPFEYFDNSVPPPAEWHNSHVICGTEEGPWKDLRERNVRMLTKREALAERFIGAKRVKSPEITVAVSGERLYFPGNVTANTANLYPLVLCFELDAETPCTIQVYSVQMTLYGNGVKLAGPDFTLKQGKNLLTASFGYLYGHWFDFDVSFRMNGNAVTLCSPFDRTAPGSVLKFPEWARLGKDSPVYRWAQKDTMRIMTEFQNLCKEIHAEADINAFVQKYASCEEPVRGSFVNHDEGYCKFRFREAEDVQVGDVENPENAIYPDLDCAVIHPVKGYDIELCYDLGTQNVGYWNFGVFAPAGTVIDIAAVEYIAPDGRIQFTNECRNAMRYVCSEGYNRFTSFARRSGRYLFLTVRNAEKPVRLQFLRLVESTYPVLAHGSFCCSDKRLDRIYSMAQRTLKLCMEDTFTDCPLYEQTLWIGDACCESLYAMSAFGAHDIVRRSLELGGQSLEKLPMIGCQVPSCWESIIPVYCFLWVMTIEEYYRETGDEEFVRKMYPLVRKNLDHAVSLIDGKNGLFKSEHWNFFDWCRMEMSTPYFLPNSFFLAAALQSAARMGELTGENDAAARDREIVANLRVSLNAVWNKRELAWPDALDENGNACPGCSIHTSMLALLYDLAEPENEPSARSNVLSPRPELIRLCTPFAAFFKQQLLEKLDMQSTIIGEILRSYMPMADFNSDTFWEGYATSTLGRDGFPTRSYVHGCSSWPLYYLPRTVLGIIPDAPGLGKVVISPTPGELTYAEGSRASIRGTIHVRWTVDREKRQLSIWCKAPAEIEVSFRSNRAISDYSVHFERI